MKLNLRMVLERLGLSAMLIGLAIFVSGVDTVEPSILINVVGVGLIIYVGAGFFDEGRD